MKTLCLLFVIFSICFFGCKKDRPSAFNGDGFIYTDGDPAVVEGGIGWYFAESRVGSWEPLPLRESELPVEYKNITVSDSIAVSVYLEKTKTQVGCDCLPGVYYYHIVSIKKR